MAVTFYYKNMPYIHINQITVIGLFNQFDGKATPLVKEKEGWYVTLDLPKGEHQYKFVINGVLKMNDPLAMMYMPDQMGEVWGIACVDAYGELILYNQRGSILLCKHVITNKVVEVFEEARYKTSFNLNMDANVCAGFEFENIVGIHTVTVVWVTPQLYMHQISEHVLAVEWGDKHDAAEVWFNIALQDNARKYPRGTWSIKVFIDGEFTMEDKFTIGTGGTYSVKNNRVLINPVVDDIE